MKALILASALVLSAGALTGAADEQGKTRQSFTGVAVSIGTPGNPTGVAPVDITVTRWSTADERQRLINAFSGEGQNSALDELQDMKPVGTIRVNHEGLAYDLRYAREFKNEDGGRRIFLLTDRPISAWEAFVRPRYSDYPFTLIEMRLDRDGRGSGTITLAARITASEDGRFVQIENYATSPIQFNDIKQTK
jgi:hypothetical protein